MYVTRPLSVYRKCPSALSLPPPEGTNSGILVIQDEEAEETCCFGLCKSHEITHLPFPQNKNLELRYSAGVARDRHVYYNDVIFIPVLDQPLSANRYYAIQPRGTHKGEAFKNAPEDDAVICSLCFLVSEAESKPADHDDVYQQFQICARFWGGFVAKSVATDGFPPDFLRRKGWKVSTSTPYNFKLDEAAGIDAELRANLPGFEFPLSHKNSEPVVVGKWYCPFMFVKDGRLRDQTISSMYYEMTLEQRWEQVFECENNHNEDNAVVVDVVVRREVAAVAGMEVFDDEERRAVEGVVWFSCPDNGGEKGFGLSLAIVERMKWEQQRFGWDDGRAREERIKRVEKFEGDGQWRKFGCYVLVERFLLKRMGGSLVFTYDFKHTHRIRSKWN